MYCALLIVFIIVSHISGSDDQENLVVEVLNGKIQGKHFVSNDENKFPYIGFLGIPFAEPPTGENRFRKPQPKENWEGILDATNNAPICMQPKMDANATSSEDCLYLNVYTPDLSGDLPVMVWIYGGAFIAGSSGKSYYGPDYLIQNQVVIVAVSYRVGIFGFLSTQDEAASGNYGLKDQILGLKWVKENIRMFGGNPDKVTIFGESAGSASVSLLVQSKAAKGLFHGAIMESGVSLSLFARTQNPTSLSYYTASLLNITVNTTNELISALRRVEATELLTASLKNFVVSTVSSNPLNGLVYGPTLEPPHEGAVLDEKCHEHLTAGDFNVVPMIVGFNSAEGNPFQKVASAVPFFLIKYDLDSKLLIPVDMNVNDSSKSPVSSQIKKYYFGKKSIGSQPELLSKFITDDQFIRPTNEFVRWVSQYANTYYYEFSHVGEISDADRALPGVGHGEDLDYLWDTKTSIGEADIPIRRKLVKLWTNFAKYGNPTPNVDEELDSVTWTPSNSINFPYLQINLTLRMETDPRKEQMDFWSSLYGTYGNPPYDTY